MYFSQRPFLSGFFTIHFSSLSCKCAAGSNVSVFSTITVNSHYITLIAIKYSVI